MGGLFLFLGVILVLGLLVVFWIIGTYNRLVVLRNQVDQAWANIDVLLKRRFDLIPNLVETVKGYMKHERETLEAVTRARSRLGSAQTPEERMEAEGQLSRALMNLFAVSEQYPDLKANQNFLQLQEELTRTENAIASQRSTYNHAVRTYNTALQVFPTNIIAGMFGFRERPYFEITEPAEREAPRVQF